MLQLYPGGGDALIFPNLVYTKIKAWTQAHKAEMIRRSISHILIESWIWQVPVRMTATGFSMLPLSLHVTMATYFNCTCLTWLDQCCHENIWHAHQMSLAACLSQSRDLLQRQRLFYYFLAMLEWLNTNDAYNWHEDDPPLPPRLVTTYRCKTSWEWFKAN